MDDDFIVTAFVVFDKTMAALGHRDDVRAGASDAEVLPVAVVAAKYFQSHLARALQVMHLGRYLSGTLSASRFNRRLHALRGWLGLLTEALGAIFAQGAVFLIDSMPVPVCKRARAWRCKKVRGKAFCSYCAAKKEAFFGWRLHLVCTATGVPVAFDLVPGGLHDLTPIHELCYGLPGGATVYGDKGYNAAADEGDDPGRHRRAPRPHPQGQHAGQRLDRQAGAEAVPQADRGAVRPVGGDGRAALASAHPPRPRTQAPCFAPRGHHRQRRLVVQRENIGARVASGP